jgi:hypothetical protein
LPEIFMLDLSPTARDLRRLHFHRESSLALADAMRLSALRMPVGYKRHRLLKRSRRIAACASSFYAKAITPDGEPTRIDIRHPRDCRDPVCPLSSRFKAARVRKKVRAIIDDVRAAHPEAPFVMLTLTMRNRPWNELHLALDEFGRAIDRFWRLREVKRAYIGSITAFEIVCRGDTAAPLAGVHCHVLCACHPEYFNLAQPNARYLSQHRLTQLFQLALRSNYRPIVHVARVRDALGGTGPESIGWVVKELLKYVCKPNELFKQKTKGLEADPHIIGVLSGALHRRRMLRIAGIFATSSRTINRQAKEANGGPQAA